MTVEIICQNCGQPWPVMDAEDVKCPSCKKTLCEECWLGATGLMTQHEVCVPCQDNPRSLYNLKKSIMADRPSILVRPTEEK
jgi:hypothetical protein